MDKHTSFRQKIALIIFGFFLSIVILEAGLRLGGFVFKAVQEYHNIVSMRKKDVYRIMCIGESTTAYLPFDGQFCYPQQLEEILNQQNAGIKFSVINKGVSAADTASIISELENNLRSCKPDMVIAMMGINDVGDRLQYKNIFLKKISLHLDSLRIFKLVKLLRLHILHKIKDFDIARDKELATFHPSEIYKISSSATASDNQSSQLSIHLSESSDVTYAELGRKYRKQGKFDLAEQLLKKAIELNPKNVAVFVEIGQCYRVQGKYGQAEEWIKKALEIDTRYALAYLRLGQLYRDQRKYIESERAIKMAVEINPQSWLSYVRLAEAYQNQAKFEEAEEAYKRATEVDPASDWAYGGLAVLYDRIGQHGFSRQYSQKVHELRAKYYDSQAQQNYQKLKEIVLGMGVKLVCVQYPMRGVDSLKRMFEDRNGIIFIDNESVFKKAVQREKYEVYFKDCFAGDFGHCTHKGNRLLAKNIARVILKEVFHIDVHLED